MWLLDNLCPAPACTTTIEHQSVPAFTFEGDTEQFAKPFQTLQTRLSHNPTNVKGAGVVASQGLGVLARLVHAVQDIPLIWASAGEFLTVQCLRAVKP